MKNSEVKLVVLLLSFFCYLSTNLLFAQPSRLSFNKYINNEGDTLNYRLLKPDAGTLRKFPLIIFLHGSGERGNDNEAQLMWGVMNFATDQTMIMHPAFVIAPQCPENAEWSNDSLDKKTDELHLLPNPSKPMELVI